jgi:hypothetical protein
LYLIATRACLQLAEQEPNTYPDHLVAAFGYTERARALAIVQSDAGLDGPDGADPLALAWQAAAAEWTNDTDRLLLGFDQTDADLAALVERADASEERLRRLEEQLEAQHPGRLSDREPPGPSLSAAQAPATRGTDRSTNEPRLSERRMRRLRNGQLYSAGLTRLGLRPC